MKNRIKCAKCGDVIESTSVHDFKQCKCGAIFVDGGNEYHRGGGGPQDIIDLTTDTPKYGNPKKQQGE